MKLPTSKKLVRDVMSHEVATLDRNDQISIADDVMRLGRIRHLPVLDADGLLAGVLSQRDLLHGALSVTLGFGSAGRQKVMNTIMVKEVMNTSPTIAHPDTPLSKAASLMIKEKIGCLPVLEGDRLVGILTESDFVALHVTDE
jgi:CBS domain-containing membrane protein